MVEEHSGFKAIGTVLLKEVVTIASASELTLGSGNIFFITGTTNISSIAAADSLDGRIIYLVFEGALTVDNTYFYLAGGGSFTSSSADVLCLMWVGSWVEVSRSVNI